MREFVIPMSRDDLLSSHSDRYVPQQIVGPDEIINKFSDCGNALRNDGYKFVLNHFDSLVSLTIHFQRLSWDNLQKGWKILHRAAKTMFEELSEILRPNHELEEDIRKPAGNATKMLVYLLTQTVTALDDRVKRIGDSKIKKKGSQNTFQELVEWQEDLQEIVVVFYDLLHLPLIWLWDPPVPSTEESFYHLISNMSFAILENPSITTSKMTKIKETLLHVLGILVVRYNYKISIVFRMVDVLNRVEHIPPTLALAVKILHDDYNCQSIVREIIKEIIESYSSEVLPQVSRNHGIFLAELGELVPASLREHIPIILPMLEQEQITLRNGVLSAVGAIVLKCLSKGDLTTADRQQRDKLLDIMMEYIYDSNAFVRVKVLNLWRKFLDEEALPQTLRCDVLEAASGRIIDTASSVRKAAIQLVTTFLEHNPASAKMGVASLQEQLDTEQVKLKAMYDKYRQGNPREMCWLEMQASVERVLQNHFEKEESKHEFNKEEESDEENDEDAEENVDDDREETSEVFLTSVHSAMCEALDKKKIMKAYKYATQIEHFAPDFIHSKKKTGIKGKVDFYLFLMGSFYAYEKLTVDALAKDIQNTPLEKEEMQQLTAQQHFVTYLEDSLNFVKQMENALTLLQKLLSWAVSNASSGINDGIVDAVRLVEVAHVGGVPGAKDCMTTELQLILHQPEAPVIAAIAASAKTVYFQSAGTDSMPRAERTVASLIKVLSTLTLGEAQAVEELMKEWVKNGDITGSCVHVAWDMFMHPERVPEPEDEHQRRMLALAVLRMMAPALPDRVRTLVPEIANNIFLVNGNSTLNLEIAAEACAVLSSTCPFIQHNHTAPVSSIRLPFDHMLFKELGNLLKIGFWLKESNNFTSLSINAINLVYSFCLSPELFIEDFLKFMLCALQGKTRKVLKDISPNAVVNEDQTQETQKEVVPYFALNRFLAVVGHSAMMQMIFMDTAIYSKIRSLEEKDKIQKSQKKTKKVPKRKTSRNKSTGFNASCRIDDSESTASSESISINGSEEAEEGTQAEDKISESIRLVCENEMFRSDKILGQLLPLVVKVISKPKSFSEPNIQRTAMLSLSKMMMVSSIVCADNIQLFVTVMGNSPDPDTRAMAVIAIADITLRFPNIVEPWSKHIYGRLQDKSDQVRLTTILILSRLVMCDMIKVRGQISDLALCIRDENKVVANAAKKFFNELSQKHNVLYNVLPDIISGLCSSSLPEEKFNSIVTFVFGLIKKDKQIEVLVEKLCQRFQLVTTEKQACDLAFCLTLLQYNNRSLGRLTDQLQSYADKLHIDKVYNYFQTIVQTNSKSKVKVELKTAAEELGAAIEQVLKIRTEDPEQDIPVPSSSSRPKSARSTVRNKKTPSKPKSVRKGVRRKIWSSSDEDLPEIPESP